MGKRPAGVELFEGNMVSMQRGIRPSMQRDEPPTMETGLERIADKCCEPTPEERSAGNLHATFCGRRRQATASASRWAFSNGRPYREYGHLEPGTEADPLHRDSVP